MYLHIKILVATACIRLVLTETFTKRSTIFHFNDGYVCDGEVYGTSEDSTVKECCVICMDSACTGFTFIAGRCDFVNTGVGLNASSQDGVQCITKEQIQGW